MERGRPWILTIGGYSTSPARGSRCHTLTFKRITWSTFGKYRAPVPASKRFCFRWPGMRPRNLRFNKTTHENTQLWNSPEIYPFGVVNKNRIPWEICIFSKSVSLNRQGIITVLSTKMAFYHLSKTVQCSNYNYYHRTQTTCYALLF